jgi:hypothetical protein
MIMMYMRNLLLIIGLLFTLNTMAQIGEVETVRKGTLIGVANEQGFPRLLKKDEQYILTYYNENLREIEDIKSITFTATEEELERLYQLFKEQYNRKDVRTVKVGENRLYLESEYDRLVVRVNHQDGTSSRLYIYPGELDPLFGKNEDN